jgi:hypothetical protein
VRRAWLVCFDNLSHLPNDLADAACRLATGGGFGGRELYSDHDEAVFDATRPLVFNTIPDLGAARPDFLDRALIVEFNDIKPEQRRDERKFWEEFEVARPRVLGALLDALMIGLRTMPAVALKRLPRMADFATWVTACAEAIEVNSVNFLEVYEANLFEGRDLALECSVLWKPLQELAKAGFRGSSADLLNCMNSIVNDRIRHSQSWPKASHALGSALRRIAGNLRAAGIELNFGRSQHGGSRIITVHAELSKMLSPLSPNETAPDVSTRF